MGWMQTSFYPDSQRKAKGRKGSKGKETVGLVPFECEDSQGLSSTCVGTLHRTKTLFPYPRHKIASSSNKIYFQVYFRREVNHLQAISRSSPEKASRLFSLSGDYQGMEDLKQSSKGQFKKGSSGNPAGRPHGSLNKATLACLQLLDGKSEQLTAKLLEMALEGNIQAMRMCLDRTVPQRKERCINLDLRPVTSLKDRMFQFEDLTSAVAEGRITPSEGESFANILISQAKTLQLVEFARRLPEIDEKEYRFKGTMMELLDLYRTLSLQKAEGSEETVYPSGEKKESPDA
jgi:Family of unknown function (DUF5681)